MGFLDKIIGGGAKALIDSVSGVVDKFVTTSDEKAAIKQAMEAEINRHMEAINAQALRENELENMDRDSARNREIAHIKATGKADHFQYFVGGVVMLTFVAVTIFLLKYELPEKNGHIIVNLVGILEGATIAIVTFYFGSSRGSREKNAQ